MPDATDLPASPLHALCVYAEPLVVGRRVVVFGDTRRRLGERLLELGARLVHVYDPEPTRAHAAATRAPRGVTVHALPAGDLDVRDGAFDVAIIADVAEVPAAAALLGRVRRLLAPGGAVLVRSAGGEAGAPGAKARQGTLDYYELYDLLAMQFAHVHMVGQIAWSGVALAELGREGDEPDVTVDTQLVTEVLPPDAFIAVGSQEDVHLAEYALIQLPSAPEVDVEATIAHGSERADLAAAQLRASLLDAQVEELRARRNSEGAAHADAMGALEAELANRITELQLVEGRAVQASTRADRVAAELRTRDDDLARLRDRATLALKELEDERRLRARAELAHAASLENADLAARGANEQGATFERTVERMTALERAAMALEAQNIELTRGLSMSEDARARLEVALAATLVQLESVSSAAPTPPPPPRTHDDDHAAEIGGLEQALRDRGQIIHAMERELERRERIVHDLVHALEEARAAGPDVPRAGDAESAPLRAKLDAAALEIARREGESATSAWRIQELEQAVSRLEDEQSELTMTIPPPAFLDREREVNDVTKLTDRLTAAEDELDVLRQALAQEHQAKTRAESGEALSQARAELARQAALLEKLSRELEAHDGVRREGESAAGAV
jgi:hypothetical protein